MHSYIKRVPYGFKQYNETHNVTNTYDSLADMWKLWYEPYFLPERYNQTPRLMVRHEDMVFRPEKVIKAVCECAGGKLAPKFQYMEDAANQGKGHGKHRSGLLDAWIKYGQSLDDWYARYNARDRVIMKRLFQDSDDHHGIFEAFQYKLFDDTDEPTPGQKLNTNLNSMRHKFDPKGGKNPKAGARNRPEKPKRKQKKITVTI